MLNSTASVLAGELVPTRRDVACAPEILGSIKESAAARNAQPWQVDGEKRFIEKVSCGGYDVSPAAETLLSESFDRAQDERTLSAIIDGFPFMLRPSKHSEAFSATC